MTYNQALLHIGINRFPFQFPEQLFQIQSRGFEGFTKKVIDILYQLNQYPAGHELFARLALGLQGRKITVVPVFKGTATYFNGIIYLPIHLPKTYFSSVKDKMVEYPEEIIFAHESIHALHDVEDRDAKSYRSRIPMKDYDDMEERETIGGNTTYGNISLCENAFLLQMGYPLRKGHGGYSFPMNPLHLYLMQNRFDLMDKIAERMDTSLLKKSVDLLIQCPEADDLFAFLVKIDDWIDQDNSYLLEALSKLSPDENAAHLYWLADIDFQKVDSQGKDVHMHLLEQVATHAYEGEDCRFFLQQEIDQRKVNLDPFLRRASALGLVFRTEWDSFF